MTNAATIAYYTRAAAHPTAADVPKFMTLLGSVSYAKRGNYVNYNPLASHK
jgi:hypothetical protein